MKITADTLRPLIANTYFPPPIDDFSLSHCGVEFERWNNARWGWRLPIQREDRAKSHDEMVELVLENVATTLNSYLDLAGEGKANAEQLHSHIRGVESWEYHENPDCDPGDDCGEWIPEIHVAVVTDFGTGHVSEFIRDNPSREEMITNALVEVAADINVFLPWARWLVGDTEKKS